MTTVITPPVLPARRKSTRVVLFSAAAGVVVAVVWSPRFVDTVIAEGIAAPIFGRDLAAVDIGSGGVAMAFAPVTGVAGMFTACNVAVFSALAPMTARSPGGRSWTVLLRPVGQLIAGAVVVAGLFGIIGVYLADASAQLSNARLGDPVYGLPVRLLQAGIVFGVIGAIMLWRGLMYVNLARNPLAGVFARHPWSETVLLGGLTGAFLTGRPYPPFRHLYAYAASTDDPAIGFVTFALQSLGNVLGVVALYLVILTATGGRFQRWLLGRPGRANRVSAAAFVTVGAFLLVYWTVRLAPRAGLVWWPTMPWNG
jgi:hypothetical protein